MMEFTKLKLTYPIKIILLCLIICYSCQENHKSNVGKKNKPLLECLLNNFKLKNEKHKKGAFLVAQHDYWTDSTAIVIISFIEKDNIPFIQADKKSKFKKRNIYYYRKNLKNKKLIDGSQISNNLKWMPWENKKSKKINQSPYDPYSIQVVYNYSNNCIQNILKGKMFLNSKWKTKCENCFK